MEDRAAVLEIDRLPDEFIGLPAAFFALGARAGVAVACALAVSDTFDARGARTRIDDHALLGAAERMGACAVAALSG